MLNRHRTSVPCIVTKLLKKSVMCTDLGEKLLSLGLKFFSPHVFVASRYRKKNCWTFLKLRFLLFNLLQKIDEKKKTMTLGNISPFILIYLRNRNVKVIVKKLFFNDVHHR